MLVSLLIHRIFITFAWRSSVFFLTFIQFVEVQSTEALLVQILSDPADPAEPTPANCYRLPPHGPRSCSLSCSRTNLSVSRVVHTDTPREVNFMFMLSAARENAHANLTTGARENPRVYIIVVKINNVIHSGRFATVVAGVKWSSVRSRQRRSTCLTCKSCVV